MLETTIDSVSLFFWLGVGALIAGLFRAEASRIGFAWGALIGALGSILGGALGNRQGGSSKQLEGLQTQELLRRSGLARMIDPKMLQQWVGTGASAVSGLPMGFGMSARDPKQQALQAMLLSQSQNATELFKNASSCPGGQFWNAAMGQCTTPEGAIPEGDGYCRSPKEWDKDTGRCRYKCWNVSGMSWITGAMGPKKTFQDTPC